MYSKTTKSAHYLPRTGSYSTVPHRNGRVDVLPPGAAIPTFDDFVDQLRRAEARVKSLVKERDLIAAEAAAEGKRWNAKWRAESKRRYIAPHEDPIPALMAKKKTVQLELDRMNGTICDIRRVMKRQFIDPERAKHADEFSATFVNLARVMLPPDTFDQIFTRTKALVGDSVIRSVDKLIGSKEGP